jgi:uncharacterized YigZ family protein
MHAKDTYLTVSKISEGFYKEKGSKFLAFAYPVSNEEEVKEIISELKKQYYDARHYCYAYTLGENAEKYRSNDDGEPGHSAGDPILGQIRSHELTNILIVVVRYFGGTKLGVGGLINAYKTAAGDAIAQNSIIEIPITKTIELHFEYDAINIVMKMVKDYELEILSQKMELACEMRLAVRLNQEDSLLAALQDYHKIRVIGFVQNDNSSD